VLGADGLGSFVTSPNAAGIKSEDGRALRLDRSGLRLDVPPVAEVGGPLRAKVWSSSGGEAWAEVLVDGRWRGGWRGHLEPGETELPIELPAALSPSRFAAVHLAHSPYAASRGATAVFWLKAGGQDDGAALRAALASEAVFAEREDPLLLQENRLPPAVEQRGEARATAVRRAERWQLPFRLTGGLFALLVTGVAAHSGWRGSRWRKHHAGEGSAGRGHGGMALLWAALALGVSLSVLGVLDWTLGFMLRGPGE
jgi:hypothetical protein